MPKPFIPQWLHFCPFLPNTYAAFAYNYSMHLNVFTCNVMNACICLKEFVNICACVCVQAEFNKELTLNSFPALTISRFNWFLAMNLLLILFKLCTHTRSLGLRFYADYVILNKLVAAFLIKWWIVCLYVFIQKVKYFLGYTLTRAGFIPQVQVM